MRIFFTRPMGMFTILASIMCLPCLALACEESSVEVPVHFMGTIQKGDLFQKDIDQHYYFAEGLLVKVPINDTPALYFWLVPDNAGWHLQIGPTKDMNPDYIGIIDSSKLHIDSHAKQTLSFCFNTDAQNYDTALKELREHSTSPMAKALGATCASQAALEVGFGTIATHYDKASGTEFSVDLRMPVYRTSCPPPADNVK